MAVYLEKDKSKWTKDGRKYYFRTYYTDMYGNKKQKQSKLYKLKSEAENAESEFKVMIKTNDETNLNITFDDVFYEWLFYKKQTVKYPTYYSIKTKMVKHVLSVFTGFKLHSIKTNNLLLWKDNMSKKETINDATLNKIIGYFQELLKYARINYKFNARIASKLQKNRISKRSEKGNDSEWNFWTPEEFLCFIDFVDDDLDKLMYNFMYYTGLRIGETCGLCWKNVDLKNKRITIKDNLTIVEEGGCAITDTKTKNSERTLDLDDDTAKLLKKHYEKESKLYNFNDSMLVFGNIKHIAFTTFRRHLYNHIEKSGVKKITPHGFRHSHVSLLIHLECDSREVAERIGDTVEMVEKTYYHMFPEKKSNPVKALNNFKNIKK